MKWIQVFLLFSVLVISFQNCGEMKSQSEGDNQSQSIGISEKANFDWIDDNIVKPTCTACHNDSLAFSGLNFTSYDGVMASVIPGRPDQSSFYNRTFSTKFFNLSDEEKEIIRLWILSGAQK